MANGIRSLDRSQMPVQITPPMNVKQNTLIAYPYMVIGFLVTPEGLLIYFRGLYMRKENTMPKVRR